MTQTPTLFDYADTAARSRATDPATSRVAAKELPLRARQQEVVDALRLIGVSATADDVKQALGSYGMLRERNECSSRLIDLDDGLLDGDDAAWDALEDAP